MTFIIPCGFPFWPRKSSPYVSKDTQTTDEDYSDKAPIPRTTPKLSPTNKKDSQPKTSPFKKAAKADPSQPSGRSPCNCQPHPVTSKDTSQDTEDDLLRKNGYWIAPRVWIRKHNKWEHKARQLKEQILREKRFRTDIYGNNLARYHGFSYSNIDLPADYATASEIPGRVNATRDDDDDDRHSKSQNVGSRERRVTARPVDRLRYNNNTIGSFGHGHLPAGVDPAAWGLLSTSMAYSYGHCM